MGAGRECSYSGASRGIGGIRALGTPRGCRGFRGIGLSGDIGPLEGVGVSVVHWGTCRKCRYSGASSSIGASGGS